MLDLLTNIQLEGIDNLRLKSNGANVDDKIEYNRSFEVDHPESTSGRFLDDVLSERKTASTALQIRDDVN